MSYQTENTIEKRVKRVDDAVALREPDRVPFAPKVNLVYAQAGGIDNYTAMMDFRNMLPGLKNFFSKYECDLYWSPSCYPINVMEVLGTTAIKWPGATWGIELDQGFQIVDGEYLHEEEYDELIQNPGHYFLTKLYPRKHKRLEALSKVSFDNFVEFGHYAGLQAFADPEVKESLRVLVQAGEEAVKWQQAVGQLGAAALEMQVPHGVIVGQNAPYDMLADNLRGYLNVPMDLLEIPEKVEAAIEVMKRYAMGNVAFMKQLGLKYAFMPMHGGTDDFMSLDTYKKHYWPSLRDVILAEIDAGITPYIFWEGKYSTRLELLKDLPRGKCIFMFEQIDIVQAKKVLGDTVCICGNLPSASLIFGSKQEVIDETKRLIDTCAPGGGFIMDCSIVLDHYKEENMEAWYQTTMESGKYR